MLKKKKIDLYEFISINDLSLMLNVNNLKIINICKLLGVNVSLNYRLDKELILLICDELGYKVNIIDKLKNLNFLNEKKKKKKKYIVRPPIISIMGHVNHGKTSLLDYIRKSNLISLEYGNITQHMGIYNVKLNNNKTITLIDTPGHESFLSIRRRGIKISDIVLIVISVDKGIMNQTIESINHAKNDNLPIIFIFSKIDKVKNIKFNIDKIKNNLKKLNINLNIKNDKYLYQKISIKTGYGIEKLINKINILSKKLNLLTNINTLNCYGIIIESYLDKKKGYLVKILVQKGILRVGDYIISNFYYGKIKNIFNDYNIKIKKVYPSYPAIIIGFNGPPFSGSKFIVLKKNYKNYIKNIINNNKLLINKKKKKKKNNNKIINIILKADVDSSISVILDEINKFDNINIVNQSIGNINQSDINLATIFNCIIIGFNIKININKKKKINNKNNIYIFNVIYDIINF
ncbi:MAG: translation initiation factor IF-2 N-terminal domain-containing protein [Candidatus Shikimatogenerans bostrichidophilus]|nr:MAG: translation initiation factor IF-2 N-terminal domain-containing protein [Candidatus Shikimatogenerans bostrichidophilus]